MLMQEARLQPPQWEQYSDTPLFNTKAVVRQTGIPAPTLRAWERRYDILTPRRGANDYRLYSERDIATITWLHARIASGLTISQAIALLRSLEPVHRSSRRNHSSETPAHQTSATESAMPAAPAAPAASGSLSLAGLSATLLRQFVNLDEAGAHSTMTQAFAVYSVEDVCISLLTPTLVRLGELWSQGAVSVTVEHFASALIRGRLESLYRSAPQTTTGPLMLVGSAPGELHDLGSLMLALFLRRAALRVVYLGQSVEATSLIATVGYLRPAGLALSASLPAQAETLIEMGRQLAALEDSATKYFVGGQAFVGEPGLVRRARGSYIGLDAHEAALEIQRRLSA
ncbi:MAG TPA: cobalamin B12-binding domain-containing protein [Ktedonobacterales bacterium]